MSSVGHIFLFELLLLVKKGVSGTIVGSAVGLSASCKQLENTIAQRGIRSSVRLAHGHMALMSGWFQEQFHHSTIPAAEWGGGELGR